MPTGDPPWPSIEVYQVYQATWRTDQLHLPPPREEMRCRECGGFSSSQVCYQCTQVTRQEFRAAPTWPAPVEEEAAPDTQPSIPYGLSYPQVPTFDNITPMFTSEDVEGMYVELIQTIDELKAGRAPKDVFEEQMLAAIKRNREREAEEKAAEEARPSRFDRI